MKHKSVAGVIDVSALFKAVLARVVLIHQFARLKHANGSVCSTFCVVVLHSGLPVIFLLALPDCQLANTADFSINIRSKAL